MKAEYTAAVQELIPLAQGDTGGSRVAAQVLLGAYNGDEFQLNIVDLGHLDRGSYIAALSVIRGRVELGIEPHTLVEHGGKIFQELWRRWERLQVGNRGLPDCSTCNGQGSVCEDPDDENNYARKTCPKCGGRGYGSDTLKDWRDE